MRSREFASTSNQLITALDRWEEDGGRAAADYQVARDNGPDPAVALLGISREARRAWLCVDALVSGNTRIPSAWNDIRRRHCSSPSAAP
jgi:hypothetical protein